MFDGPNANPKVITLDENGSAVIVAVGRSSSLRDGRAGTDANGHLAAMPGGGDDFIYEVKSFHDNRIQIKHLRHNVGGLPHTEYVTIDNVRPVLAVYGPAQPLYVRRGVNVTFIFEFLDVDSGFTDEQEENTSPVLVSTPVLNHPDDDSVKLVVAGNVVGLQARQISKTDNGWRVKRSLSSNTIQQVEAHVRLGTLMWRTAQATHAACRVASLARQPEAAQTAASSSTLFAAAFARTRSWAQRCR